MLPQLPPPLKNIEVAGKNLSFSQKILLIFFGFGLLGILNHAMWRDELNGWLMARDSSFPLDFFRNIRYEGHPALWYIFLYLLNQLTPKPLAMQIFHLLIATGSMAVFLQFSPFTKWQKVLFCFGYLPFYEYLLISRNYAIGIFWVFSVCAIFETRKKSYILISVLLALMANSNAYCLSLSVGFCLTLILEYILARKLGISLTASRKDCLSSLSIYLIGVLTSVVMLIPPTDSTLQGGATQWMLQFDFMQLGRTLARIWNSYILVIVASDSKLLDVWVVAILSLSLLAFAATMLVKKPIVLFFYLVASLEILAFTYIKFLGSPRHYGHLYIILIVSLWLASYYPSSELLTGLLIKLPQRLQTVLTNWLNFVSRRKLIFIAIVLAAQLVAGIVAFSRDLTWPYSASREAANFIEANHLDKLFIVGSEDFAVSPISGYLNRKIYYPEINHLGSFVLFTKQREILNPNTLLQKIEQISQQKQEKILLILNHELSLPPENLNLSTLAKFTRALIHNERYYLYLVEPIEKKADEKTKK